VRIVTSRLAYDNHVIGLDQNMFEEGLRQIQSGVALITWSRLASWDSQSLTLIPAQESDFESHHRQVHSEFGRLLCWIAFGVGGEYLAKGACILSGHLRPGPGDHIRLPSPGEDVESWVELVNKNDSTIRESELHFTTLGKLPVGKIPKLKQEQEFVTASIKLLASTIRNRDAHRYTRNVRAFHFHVVGSLFVPAFNILLASLSEIDLRSHLPMS